MPLVALKKSLLSYTSKFRGIEYSEPTKISTTNCGFVTPSYFHNSVPKLLLFLHYSNNEK